MLIIGIAGGTGSGKTTVVKEIAKNHSDRVAVISQDSYYKDSSHLPLEERYQINFDHPDSIEFDLLTQHIKQLKNGNAIDEPTYSYLTCSRLLETIRVMPHKVIIIEGILILTHPPLRKLMDLKVFVDADADERLIRVIGRDIKTRGRTADQVIERYSQVLKPMHEQFIEPTKKMADIIIPQGGKNKIAIQILTQFIKSKLLLNE